MDPYSVLGISRDANVREIKRKYQELLRKCHPDKIGPEATPTQLQSATERYHALSSAYQLLIDETRRKEHDITQRLNELTDPYIINDTLTLTEITSNSVRSEGEDEYWYDCRCGGVYAVSVREVMERVSEGNSGLVVECDTCSLHIKIVC